MAVNYSETETKEPGSKQAAISEGNRHVLKRSREEDSRWELEANEKQFRMPEGSEQSGRYFDLSSHGKPVSNNIEFGSLNGEAAAEEEESEIAKIMEILSHDSHLMDFGDGESENSDDEEFSVSQIRMFELELEGIADGSNGVDQAQVQAAKVASPDMDEAEEAQVVPCGKNPNTGEICAAQFYSSQRRENNSRFFSSIFHRSFLTSSACPFAQDPTYRSSVTCPV